MASIAIITDSDSSLPPQLASRYNIAQVPISVHFGEDSLDSLTEINDKQLFERIDKENKLPTTAAPSPNSFVQAFQKAFDAGADSVICLCVSQAVSSTYNAARTACDLMPEKDIHVVDSENLSMGQGFMVLSAAEAIQEGASVEEAIQRALNTGQRTITYASLATLKYLAMSGRVGSLAAGMANFLNIKPVLTIQNGKLEMLEKIRTRKKSWQRVIDLTAEAAKEHSIERAAIIHANCLQDAEAFAEQCRASLDCPPEIIMADFTPGLSVHAGSGVVGLVTLLSSS